MGQNGKVNGAPRRSAGVGFERLRLRRGDVLVIRPEVDEWVEALAGPARDLERLLGVRVVVLAPGVDVEVVREAGGVS